MNARSARSGRASRTARGSASRADQRLFNLVLALGGWWWDWRTGIVLGTGVSSWTDRVAGKVVSQVTGSKQPTYGANGLTFTNAAASSLAGASGFLLGAPGHTVWICGNMAGNANQYAWAYGIVGNQDAGIFAPAGGLAGYLRKSAGVINTWTTALSTPFVRGVYMSQAQFADGAAAQKQLTLNGSTSGVGGSRTASGDQTGGSYSSSVMSIGSYVDGSLSMDMTVQHVIVAPSQVAASVDAPVSSLLHAIEGF